MVEKGKELALTNIFQIETEDFQKRRQEAVRRLVSSRTPVKSVKQREGRGGTTLNYVDIGYMVEQANLLTCFNWAHEVLKEETRGNSNSEPVEVGALIRVTIGSVSHDAWGQKDIARYSKDDPKGNYKKSDIISLFDDRKAAVSDGIKKCLSYFGIAADVYAGKELEYFETEGVGSETSIEVVTSPDAAKAFMKFLQDRHILASRAIEILGVKSWPEVKDWREAYNKVKGVIES